MTIPPLTSIQTQDDVHIHQGPAVVISINTITVLQLKDLKCKRLDLTKLLINYVVVITTKQCIKPSEADQQI